MTTSTEQRRTIEARLDRLRKRLDRGPLNPSALAAIMKGILDLLTDVLLEDE